MKRKQFTLFAGILMLGMAFFATSCTKEVTEIISETNIDQVSVNVRANEWEVIEFVDENNNPLGERYYRVTKLVPKMTKYILDHGVVTAYRVLDDGGMEGLPFLSSYGYDVDLPDGSTVRQYYTEYIGYQFNAGEVTFFVEVSDLDGLPPFDMSFEIRMAW